jgi:hypothetical protein
MIYFVHERAEAIKTTFVFWLGCYEKYRKMGVASDLVDYAISRAQEESDYIDKLSV